MTLTRVYISGPAEYEDAGYFEVRPASYPSSSTQEQIENDSITVQAYDWDSDHPFAVPIHVVCYTLLGKVVSALYGHGTDLYVEVLYNTMKELSNPKEKFCSYLSEMDYGAISQYQEQYWVTERGT